MHLLFRAMRKRGCHYLAFSSLVAVLTALCLQELRARSRSHPEDPLRRHQLSEEGRYSAVPTALERAFDSRRAALPRRQRCHQVRKFPSDACCAFTDPLSPLEDMHFATTPSRCHSQLLRQSHHQVSRLPPRTSMRPRLYLLLLTL